MLTTCTYNVHVHSPELCVSFLSTSLPLFLTSFLSAYQELVSSGPTPSAPPPGYASHHPPSPPHGMQWSVWSVHGGHPSPISPHHLHPPAQAHLPAHLSRSDPLAVSTLQLHQVRLSVIHTLSLPLKKHYCNVMISSPPPPPHTHTRSFMTTERLHRLHPTARRVQQMHSSCPACKPVPNRQLWTRLQLHGAHTPLFNRQSFSRRARS